MVAPVSGGRFNPVVSLADAAFDGLRWRDAAAYLPAQVTGGIGGAVIANLMFARAAVSVSAKDRSSPAHFLGRVQVSSAGSRPASELNPAVVAAMAEIGPDLSRKFPKPLTGDRVQAADVVITMGCGDAGPFYPGKRYLDWDLPDPAGLDVVAVRPIRDGIHQRVRQLLSELDGPA